MADASSKSLPKVLHTAVEGKTGVTETQLPARKSIIIGRGSDCDVVIGDRKASRKHCRLSRGETSFILEDLGSKNGTFVDGVRIKEPVSLQTKQAFKIGDTMLYLG